MRSPLNLPGYVKSKAEALTLVDEVFPKNVELAIYKLKQEGVAHPHAHLEMQVQENMRQVLEWLHPGGKVKRFGSQRAKIYKRAAFWLFAEMANRLPKVMKEIHWLWDREYGLERAAEQRKLDLEAEQIVQDFIEETETQTQTHREEEHQHAYQETHLPFGRRY